MTSVSDVKFGTLVLRAGGAGWLRFILWLNPKRSLDRKMVLFRGQSENPVAVHARIL